jgi:hypothetical protein
MNATTQRLVEFRSYLNDRAAGRFAECARCGLWNQLVKSGRVWLQPDHDCDGELRAVHAMQAGVAASR